MKVTIELFITIVGEQPSDEVIEKVISDTVPSIFLSEDCDQPGDWALEVNSFSVSISHGE